MKIVLKKIIKKLNFDNNSKEVIIEASKTSLLKFFNVLFSFFTSILIVRLLGAQGLGLLSIFNKFLLILTTLSLFGLTNLIIKEVSVAYSKKLFLKISNIIFNSLIINISLVIIFSLIFMVLADFLSHDIFSERELYYPLFLISIVLLPQVVTSVLSSVIVGYGRPFLANLFSSFFNSLLLLIVFFYFWISKTEINLLTILKLYCFTACLSSIFMVFYMNHSLKLNFNNLTLKVKKLVKSSTPFFKINLSSVIINNSDIIIIGALVDPIKVGFYVVASKLALFTSFFLQSSMSSILPKISSLYHDNKLNELQFFLKKINLLFITLSLIIFPTYVLFGKFFLSIWGNEFESSYYVLIILAAGQTFNLATGPVGGVLTMTVYERLQSKISMISAVFNLILTFLLVSKFGIIGAAFSTAFNIMLINLIKIFIVRHKLKFKFF